MACLLILLAMVASASSMQNKYIYNFTCDGIASGVKRICIIPDDVLGGYEVNYYDFDVLNYYASVDKACDKVYFEFKEFWGRAGIRVSQYCNATLGIKLKKTTNFIYKGGCGQDNYGHFKIINGQKAADCQFPWMVFLRRQKPSGSSESCGASIINDRWILTAGHCIISQSGDGRRPPGRVFSIRTGSLNKDSGYIDQPVRQPLVHPKFNRKTLSHDIALLKLLYPIKFDGCHVPVCLSRQKTIDTSLECFISGWGRSARSSNKSPKNLLWAKEVLVSRDKCDKAFGSSSTNNTLCGRAGSDGFGGFCSSDSGGPMVCKSKRDGRFYQHGVVSAYAEGAKYCDTVGLYSSVAAFYCWIQETIKANADL